MPFIYNQILLPECHYATDSNILIPSDRCNATAFWKLIYGKVIKNKGRPNTNKFGVTVYELEKTLIMSMGVELLRKLDITAKSHNHHVNSTLFY